MGKKRVVAQANETTPEVGAAKAAGRAGKKRLTSAIVHVQCTYNNTFLTLTDQNGEAVLWSSAGSLGFRGAKKGTTFAASKVGELVAERADGLGIKDIDVVVKGVGSGREAAIRSFITRGMNILSIKDATPVPFNGPKPRKPRRV